MQLECLKLQMQGEEIKEVRPNVEEEEGILTCGQVQNNVKKRLQWHKLGRDPCNCNIMKNLRKK